MSQKTTAPEIQWDFGTAYEFFISLHVLHEPDSFGIRPSYAAGVRSRIPAVERKLLEDVYPFSGVPLRWLYNLPTPKDAISALWTLRQIPPAERMTKIYLLDEPHPGKSPEELEKHARYHAILTRATTDGKWGSEDIEFLLKIAKHKHGGLKKETVERYLGWWSRPAELGEGFLSAMQVYYQAFFADEERRVAPILKEGLERAQSLAATLGFDELFFELSQGIQAGDEFRAKKHIFIPAFWTTPLIFYDKLDPDTMLLFFGARPAEMSAIPGESLPEGLVRSLKALADPTRLKILHYLSRESLTPSELARRLKLRAPTVTHHLSELRLARLVELSIQHDERRYAIRAQALESTFGSLTSFLNRNTSDE
jgi:DNA-binding transcriptional ArsR family regulator